jgi:His-Xaa-Ser system radical SAM maturase HxsB
MTNSSLLSPDSEEAWAALPYNVDKIRDRYLVVSLSGSWDFLSRDEYRQLSSFSLKRNTGLYNRLRERGLIIENAYGLERLIDDYRCFNLNLFTDVGLHIAVLTNRCNLACVYCQTNSKSQCDMDTNTASKVLEFIFSAKNPNINIEFQGGEPLLNWETLRFFVDYTRRYNLTGRKISLSLVSNFTLMDDEKLKFLIDNEVNLCASLDGPKKIHDTQRKTVEGGPSYDKVIYWLEKINKEYKRRKITNRTIGVLLTITKQSLPFYKEIVDQHVNLGLFSLPLRPLNKIGEAKENWDKIGYTPEEFIDFWRKGMDYMLKLNQKGIFIYERMARVMLRKILNKEDPGYVDLCSPCGAGRSTMAYSPEGDVYTCDEARMIGEDLFKLGNVLDNSYEEVMASPLLMQTCQASLLNFFDYASAYSTFGGNCPVLNYIEQGSPVCKMTQSSFFKIQRAQFRYLFEKIAQDNGALRIFKSWVERK